MNVTKKIHQNDFLSMVMTEVGDDFCWRVTNRDQTKKIKKNPRMEIVYHKKVAYFTAKVLDAKMKRVR